MWVVKEADEEGPMCYIYMEPLILTVQPIRIWDALHWHRRLCANRILAESLATVIQKSNPSEWRQNSGLESGRLGDDKARHVAAARQRRTPERHSRCEVSTTKL
eukprot:SAG31_NODE_4583_length_3118_cov_2.039086_1_plen_104_part_00